MAEKRDILAEDLKRLADDLRDLLTTITTDQKKQARKERAWTMLAGALTVGATMLARRGTAKLWGVLTGEPPPIGPAAQASASTAEPAAQPSETPTQPVESQAPA